MLTAQFSATIELDNARKHVFEFLSSGVVRVGAVPSFAMTKADFGIYQNYLSQFMSILVAIGASEAKADLDVGDIDVKDLPGGAMLEYQSGTLSFQATYTTASDQLTVQAISETELTLSAFWIFTKVLERLAAKIQ